MPGPGQRNPVHGTRPNCLPRNDGLFATQCPPQSKESPRGRRWRWRNRERNSQASSG